MKRRTFIKTTSLATAGTALTGPNIAETHPGSSDGKKLTAADVNSYLRSLCRVKEPSVDRVIIGNPQEEVSKLGTAWTPYWKTLKEAVDLGVNTLVVHEPTFYSHWDLEAKDPEYTRQTEAGKHAYLKVIKAKKKWILENGLTIIRCHDVLDIVPEFGIPYAFGQALGFSNSDILKSKKYYNSYKLKSPAPAIAVAKQIAAKLEAADQPGVAFYGDPDYRIRSIALGTGCACDPLGFMDSGADLYIGIDDTIRTWTQTTFAEDTGLPLIVINHGTSEEFGMRVLNGKLKEAFPGYEVEHMRQGCGYRWVTT